VRTEADPAVADSRLAQLEALTAPRQLALTTHPLYGALVDAEALRVFMSLHVWAVYDFMVLLGRLRDYFAPSGSTWLPPRHREAARAVNEIVVAEESDESPFGGHCSHFELYLAAMAQIGVPCRPMLWFLERVMRHGAVAPALDHHSVPEPARRFCTTTVTLSSHVVPAAAAFCFGREQLLPVMCEGLLRGSGPAPLWAEYLRRHISLDGEVHGPAAAAILHAACGDSPRKWSEATSAAVMALDARLALWDAALGMIHAQR
jgi:hypothetical protein